MKTQFKKWLDNLIRRFNPSHGSTYGYVVCDGRNRGAWRLDHDGEKGEIYYYSYATTGRIDKRHYNTTVGPIESYSTDDLSIHGLRPRKYTMTLSHAKNEQELAKEKFYLIANQFASKYGVK